MREQWFRKGGDEAGKTGAAAWPEKLRRLSFAALAAIFLLTNAVGCAGTAGDGGGAAEAAEDTAGRAKDASADASGEPRVVSELPEQSDGLLPDEIPPYSGEAYAVMNRNMPYFTDSDCSEEPFEQYSELDGLGRCGTAFANICRELMPAKERGPIGHVRPSGWHTVKYDIVDGNYLYNRCHLIGYQLAGENANEENLITGTRYLNTEGMLPFENQVADYVKETDHHVLYRVTPIFAGENLVADGVLMEAWSVEDNGAGVCFNVFVYNVQPGIGIDFATGESWQEDADAEISEDGKSVGKNAPKQEEPELKEEPEPKEEPEQTDAPEPKEEPGQTDTPEPKEEPEADAWTMEYILNTNTMKFHYPDCSSVRQMSDANKQEYVGTREDLIAKGYDPCGRCQP